MKKNNVVAEIALIAAVIIWGFSFISIKICVDVISPMTLIFIRFMMASLILFILLKIKEPKARIKKKHMPSLILSGILGITLYYYLETMGIKLVSPSHVSIIGATIPLFTVVGDLVMYKNKITLKITLSLILSLLGICFVVGTNFSMMAQDGSGKGYIMVFASVLCWVLYTLLTKSLFESYSGLFIVTYQTIFATIVLVPFAMFEGIKLSNINGVVLINILYLGIISSALAYYLYTIGMQNLGISKSSFYVNLIPIITILASSIILKEKITLNIIIGTVLILLSVYLLNDKEKCSAEKV